MSPRKNERVSTIESSVELAEDFEKCDSESCNHERLRNVVSMLLHNGITSHARWLLLQEWGMAGQNFTYLNFLFFIQLDGISGGAGLICQATSLRAKQILPKIMTSHFKWPLINDLILIGTTHNISKTKRS